MPFTKLNLNYLTKDVYDAEFLRSVYQSAIVSYQELKEDKIAYDGPVRIIYHTKDTYKKNARLLGLMDDFRVRKHLFYNSISDNFLTSSCLCYYLFLFSIPFS